MLYLPYGKTTVDFDDTGMHILRSNLNRLTSERPGAEYVREAMRHPIHSKQLFELAQGKRTCTIIISDHTRPVPSRDILPAMLSDLRQGNPDIVVTLLVATGFHRKSTKQELIAKLGEEITARERIVVHDCSDPKTNITIGRLPSGAPLVIDRVAAEADLLVSEGFIEPHFFAGFSGGRKSVLPGVCDRVTVLGNHCSKFIDSPFARTGVLNNNPIHSDMVAAARMAKLAFIVNTVIDDNKKIVAAFAGDPIEAHETGCAFLKNYCEVNAVPGDIVITTNGGAPLDQNLYQCVKGLTAAEATAKEGAILIMLAECADGTGGDAFFHSLADCESPLALYNSIMQTPQLETIPDQWESQILARILIHHKVIFVSNEKLESVIRKMKMDYAPSLDSALDAARKEKGPSASVVVIPNGISVIVKANTDT